MALPPPLPPAVIAVVCIGVLAYRLQRTIPRLFYTSIIVRLRLVSLAGANNNLVELFPCSLG